MKFFRLSYFLIFFLAITCEAQETIFKGFVETNASYVDDKLSFGFGEQDFFLTSELTDKISFLGESVIKYSPASPTHFDVGFERVLINYNYFRNHNVLMGKQHTPVNYWNDTYHHGRLLFPTIFRPLVFSHKIIPIHNTGLILEADNLGPLKMGYDIMISNGISAGEFRDNDKRKALTIALNAKPAEGLKLWVSYYIDNFDSTTTRPGGGKTGYLVDHNVFTFSTVYFRKRWEILSEFSMAQNSTDSISAKTTNAYYGYIGYKLGKFVPYIGVDDIAYEVGEMYYNNIDMTSFLIGIRYEFSYLAVLKLEYQRIESKETFLSDGINLQFAVGF